MFFERVPPGWEDFFENKEINSILNRNFEVLQRRRRMISQYRIWPENSSIFESFYYLKPDEIKVLILLPHAYSFNSRTGIPVMIRGNSIKPTISLNNLLKTFKELRTDDFSYLWENGIFLLNVALTEEEYHPLKISHETFWSLFMEKLVTYVSNISLDMKRTFVFTGVTTAKYKNFVNLLNGKNEIEEVPAITDKDFSEKLKEILF